MSKTAKSIVCGVISFVVIVAFAPACCKSTKPSATKAPSDAFAVNKLIGRGVNLGGALEAPKEGKWGVTLQEEYFQVIKDTGFDSIRLPVCWSGHALNEKPYTINPNFFKRVDWAVKNALSRNLALILNVHNYDELRADPNGHKERFLALWKQIAEHYKDYPNTLLFELLNEPHGNLRPDTWNSLLEETLVVVRQSNPNRTIIIGPASLNHVDNLNLLELPENDRNIIVTVHYYSPQEFTCQGVGWMPQAKAWLGTKWTGSDAEKKAVTDEFDIAAAWAKQRNRPMHLGEFGAYEKADMESRARWTKFVADTAVERGMSFHYWQFASNFAVYDTKNKTWIKPLFDALLPPH